MWISILLLHSAVDTAVALQSGNPLCLCIFEFLKGDSCLFAKKISIFFAMKLQEILQNAVFPAYPPYPQAAHSTVCGYFQRVITGNFRQNLRRFHSFSTSLAVDNFPALSAPENGE